MLAMHIDFHHRKTAHRSTWLSSIILSIAMDSKDLPSLNKALPSDLKTAVKGTMTTTDMKKAP